MKKIIFCNLDLLRLFSAAKQYCIDFRQYADQLCSDGNNLVYFISRDNSSLKKAQTVLESHGFTQFRYKNRNDVKSFIEQNRQRNNYFVFISGKEIDFYLAVNTHSLFIVPTWIPVEKKAQYYGVPVDHPLQLYNFIRTLNNQQAWYATATIDAHTQVLSLIDGKYRYNSLDMNEQNLVKHFELLLKSGTSRSYFNILFYHFLAGITNSTLLDDIELFGIIPSSDCSLNQDMFSFMHQTRYIKGKQIPRNTPHGENLLLRKKVKNKAHLTHSTSERIQMGAIEEFNTLCINPDFQRKINRLQQQGRFNVCIFDDYLTHGNSFNAVRNLLENLGVNKIIFISIGNFGRPFQKKDYHITGNVYDIGYTYSLIDSKEISFQYDNLAKQEVSDLYNIFNS